MAKPGAVPPGFTRLVAGPVFPLDNAEDVRFAIAEHLLLKTLGGCTDYFEITPQAMRAPALPAGSVFRSSAFS